MNAIRTTIGALLACTLSSVAAPRIQLSTPTITPESTIEVVFDLPVAAPADLGKAMPNHLLEISPALPGKLLWKAQTNAVFTPDQCPAMGTTYRFAVAKDRRYCDGTAIPAGEFGTVTGESLKVVSTFSPDQYLPSHSPSTASRWLVFNDEVLPEIAARFVVFQSTAGERIKADLKISPPGTHSAGTFPTWRERFNRRCQPAVQSQPPTSDAAPAPIPTVLVATPATPLSVNQSWSLVVVKGFPNKSVTATLNQDFRLEIGYIKPFTATSAKPLVSSTDPRRIEIEFSQPLPSPLAPDFLANGLALTPRPANLTAEVAGHTLTLAGDFSQSNHFNLVVKGPLTSKDGYELVRPFSQQVVFHNLDPALDLPSHDEAQLATGSRSYRIQTTNLTALRVKVKQLAGTDTIRAYQGYRHYSGDGPDYESIGDPGLLPVYLIGGTTVYDQELELDHPIDTAKDVVLDWNRILPKELRQATLFLDIIGTVRGGIGKDGTQHSQAIVQLTDLGLAWKISPERTLIYAFSCATGQPLKDVALELFAEECKSVATAVTDASGCATLPVPRDVRHLRATLGQDSFITAFDKSLATVGLWHFPVPHTWRELPATTREAMLFTDRSLYRPGETVRLKGIVRSRSNNTLQLDKASAATISIIDPTEKEIFTQAVTFSATGSFDLTYPLPATQVGVHLIRLEYPDELAKAQAIEDWEQQEAMTGNARFEIQLQVEDFRRNAFEVTQTIQPPAPAATTLEAAFEARYYQGQPVAAGKVTSQTRITQTNPYPENYRDFLFGYHRQEDWRYWHHYFATRWEMDGDSEGEGYDYEDPHQTPSIHQAETTLSAEGKASLTIPLPESDFPTQRSVSITAETTDTNNQTLTSNTTTTMHPASVYVGVSRIDSLVRAGSPLPLKLVAIAPDGSPLPTAAKVTATLTREVNTATKVQTDAGQTTTRNDVDEETVASTELTIPAASSAEVPLAFTVTPNQTGLHFLTVSGTDPEGREFGTVVRFHAYGTDDYPWLYEDGLRVKLVAEKQSYKPGETARILVLSPIEGTALVTIEREQVIRSFLTQLKADNPVIEVPLTDDDAPNACISVLIVKGANESARQQYKQPQLRLGYCQLKVENLRDRLTVALTATGSEEVSQPVTATTSSNIPSFRPGEEITFAGTVTLADGTPAANAEVTLYAEDEGTLAVMGYATPDPMASFYSPRFLQVKTGTSFETFIAEDPELQSFFNKGYFVGGGGDFGDLSELLRKNFDPCATWVPTLTTDAEGRFSHTFKLPDTLTRYRVIAIAHQQAGRFGQGVTAVLANKPLMLEPKAPRFANQGDLIKPQLLVQNASEFTGTWRITYQAHAGSDIPVCRALSNATETVTLAPGASANLVFPSVLDTTGEAVSTWQAVPVSLSETPLTPVLARRLSDAVEARYPVHYPMPLIHQLKVVKVDPQGTGRDLLKELDQSLLAGTGELNVEFTTTNLIEAAGSIDYLLSYPHGCIEQTTSSLMPWFAVETLRPFVPAFAKLPAEKVKSAIQAGADRLLSMQLADGSFAYWPGSTQRVDWAGSYAGLGLILARHHGANIPDEAITKLTNHLLDSLRGLGDPANAGRLNERARALWVLALADQAQPAYQNLLSDRLADLSHSGRAFLALAIAHSKQAADVTTAKAILLTKLPPKPDTEWWMPYDQGEAVQLLAWSGIDFGAGDTQRAFDALLGGRSPYGHWHNTWVNGWSLLAITAYAKHSGTELHSTLTLDTADGPQILKLDATKPTASLNFRLNPDLKLTLANDNRTFVRLRLAAKPKIVPQVAVTNHGMSIDRFYERVKPDGTTEVLTEPAVGDLLKVTLRVTLEAGSNRYLVVEDPLPAVFETVNNDFESQRSAIAPDANRPNWNVSHTELRSDRAVFYLDYVGSRGTYTVSYLARCTLAGEATAPQAKVESMYDPTRIALSASRQFKTKP